MKYDEDKSGALDRDEFVGLYGELKLLGLTQHDKDRALEVMQAPVSLLPASPSLPFPHFRPFVYPSACPSVRVFVCWSVCLGLGPERRRPDPVQRVRAVA